MKRSTAIMLAVAASLAVTIGAVAVNDENVAEGRIEHTQASAFSVDETTDVGIDLGTPVVEAIGAERASKFTGRIYKVTVEVKP